MSSSSVGKPVLPSIGANTPVIVEDETLSAISAAKPASESLAASSTACPSVLAAPSMSLASSASESTTLTLPDVLSKLRGESSHADAEQLLQDIPVLQEWQCATRPSHKVRDAMMKLGTRWNVPQKTEGKKRSPSEVAKDMEESMLKKAKLVLTSNVSIPATQSASNLDVPATPTMSSPSSAAKPACNHQHSVATPTMSSSSSAAKPAANQQHVFPGDDNLDVLATPTMSCLSSAAKPATSQVHSFPVASESMTLNLPDLLSRLQGNSSQTDAQQLLQDIPVLEEWQRATNPSHKVRDAMMKLGAHWNVPQYAK